MQIPCPNCQTLNRAGGKFCMKCGKPLSQPAAPAQAPRLPQAAPQPFMPSPPPPQPQPFRPAPPQPAYTPPAYAPAASANAGASKGHRLIGPGGAAAILLFFLPWISVSCQRQTALSFSGWNLAAGGQVDSVFGPVPINGSGEFFIILLAAIACATLGALVYMRRISNRPAALGAVGAVAISVLILLIKLINPLGGQSNASGIDTSMLRIDPQIGLIGTLLAYVAIVVGAVMDLRNKP